MQWIEGGSEKKAGVVQVRGVLFGLFGGGPSCRTTELAELKSRRALSRESRPVT
jgi:hypothetical protein